MTDKPYILCVDDERAILNVLKEQIKLKFDDLYNIEIAESGSEAIKYFEELKASTKEVPLVICDYIMPDIKGDEVFRRIQEICPETMLFLLTGQATLNDIKSAVNKARIFKFIAKPWNKDFLYSSIEEALNLFNTRKNTYDSNSVNYENDSIILKDQRNNQRYKKTRKTSSEADGVTYKTIKEVSESLDSIKTGMEIILNIREKSEYEGFETLGKYIKSFDANFTNILNSINTLSCSFENYNIDEVVEKESYYGINEVYEEVKEIKHSTYLNISELTDRLYGIEKLLKKEPKKIVARDDEEILLFNPDEVLFFYSEGKNIFVVTKKGKYKVRETMYQLEVDLCEHNFFRCHKSYLINLKYVSKIAPWIGYNSYISTLDGYDTEIPVSRNYIGELKRILGI